jgi:hypothetical protein
MASESPHRGNASTRAKEGFEEAPAVRRDIDQIESKLTESQTLDAGSAVRDKCLPQLTPPSRSPDINKSLKSRAAQVEYILRCRKVHLGEKSNCRNTRKLADELCNLRHLRPAATCHRDDHSVCTMGFEVVYSVLQ